MKKKEPQCKPEFIGDACYREEVDIKRIAKHLYTWARCYDIQKPFKRAADQLSDADFNRIFRKSLYDVVTNHHAEILKLFTQRAYQQLDSLSSGNKL